MRPYRHPEHPSYPDHPVELPAPQPASARLNSFCRAFQRSDPRSAAPAIPGQPEPGGQNWHDIIASVLPEIRINDHVRLRKPHPCGSYDWKIYRLGADIGLECLGCGRRVLLDRRTLAHRLKKILTEGENVEQTP